MFGKDFCDAVYVLFIPCFHSEDRGEYLKLYVNAGDRVDSALLF